MTFNVSAGIIAEILARLDLVVFERLPEGVFYRIAPVQPPAWFSRLFHESASQESVTLAEVFPFLERFLSDAEELWREGGVRRLRSDAFTVGDHAEGELTLAASAVVVDHRCFLILELPYDVDERRTTLQRARELVLEHEAQVRRTAALLPRVNAAHTLARQLAASELTAAQRPLAAGIEEQLAGLAESIATLAPTPKGVRSSR
jgi:hypothetical protein